MTKDQLKRLRNAGITYCMVNVFYTLFTFTWVILSPGDADSKWQRTSADVADDKLINLWMLYGLTLGVIAAITAGVSMTILRDLAYEERERERNEIARVDATIRARQYDVTVPWPLPRKRLTESYLDRFGLDKNGNPVERWPNDERTHTIALRYNSIRDHA